MKKAFTIIELLVVVAIIGTLTGLAIVNYDRAQSRSRDTRRVADLLSVQAAMEMYKSENKIYPTADGWSIGLANSLKSYLPVLPQDPLGGSFQYYYYKIDSGWDSKWQAECLDYYVLYADGEGTIQQRDCPTMTYVNIIFRLGL